jgi:hypothetical protein
VSYNTGTNFEAAYVGNEKWRWGSKSEEKISVVCLYSKEPQIVNEIICPLEATEKLSKTLLDKRRGLLPSNQSSHEKPLLPYPI